MICAWKELLSVLPSYIRQDVDRVGCDDLQEIRLRNNAPPELVLKNKSIWLRNRVSTEDISYVINFASRYSPWAASSVSKGFITAPGGHRIGICGEAVCKEGRMEGIRYATSICIRVAKDYSKIADGSKIRGSVLVLGAPGWGKTTLLRDLIRQLAEKETVCVVDERGELFPPAFSKGKRMDVMTGCTKAEGLERLLRTMSPNCLAIDEITEKNDCMALIQAANCGVRLAATAHASSMQDFLNRKVYESLIEQRVFQTIFLLSRDKSYTVERLMT